MNRTLRRGLMKTFCTILTILCLLLIAPYLRYTSYIPEDNKPFTGSHWYNPYSDISDSLLRANFHAHSRSWGGLTWGKNSAEEVIEAYQAQGYQIPVLSNYHRIADSSLYEESVVYIPAYEHGFNLKKIHCLCIGAHETSFVEYPLHFSTNLTTHVIYNLRRHCDLVALAHPGARRAHEPDEMPALHGMQLMEVANTQGARTLYWDTMLSCGQPVWFLANDDSHDLNGREAFMRWNMIYVNTPTASEALASLKRGNHYGVSSYDGECEDNRLTEFEFHRDTLWITLRDMFNRLDFIGQDGVQLHSVSRNTTGWYLLRETDTYVRAEVHHDHCVMYLNPVVRYDGVTLPQEGMSAPGQNEVKTWVGRLLFLLLFGIVIICWRRVMRRLT